MGVARGGVGEGCVGEVDGVKMGGMGGVITSVGGWGVSQGWARGPECEAWRCGASLPMYHLFFSLSEPEL